MPEIRGCRLAQRRAVAKNVYQRRCQRRPSAAGAPRRCMARTVAAPLLAMRRLLRPQSAFPFRHYGERLRLPCLCCCCASSSSSLSPAQCCGDNAASCCSLLRWSSRQRRRYRRRPPQKRIPLRLVLPSARRLLTGKTAAVGISAAVGVGIENGFAFAGMGVTRPRRPAKRRRGLLTRRVAVGRTQAGAATRRPQPMRTERTRTTLTNGRAGDTTNHQRS